eukprot:730397-Pleurochrysis_carterae.AAC.1
MKKGAKKGIRGSRAPDEAVDGFWRCIAGGTLMQSARESTAALHVCRGVYVRAFLLGGGPTWRVGARPHEHEPPPIPPREM